MDAPLMNIIMASGIACIIAAIVGGGLKAFGNDIPIITSTFRQVALGVFGLVLLGYANYLRSPPVEPSTPTATPRQAPAGVEAQQQTATRPSQATATPMSIPTAAPASVPTLTPTAQWVAFPPARGAPTNFWQPRGIAVDGHGSIYIAIPEHKYVQKRNVDGSLAAVLPKSGNLGYPYAIAIDRNNNVYVADSGYHVVHQFDSSGVLIGTLGKVDAAERGMKPLEEPVGVAVDGSLNVYISEVRSNRVQRRSSDGEWTTLADHGEGTGQVRSPRNIAIDSNDDIYIADVENNRIQKYSVRGGTWTTFPDEKHQQIKFDRPRGVAVDRLGSIYVADTNNNRVVMLSSKGDLVDQWPELNANGNQISFNMPRALAIDERDERSRFIYVTDADNHRVLRLLVQD